MAIRICCPHCRKSLLAPDAKPARKGKCPGCGSEFLVANAVVEDGEAPAFRLETQREQNAEQNIRGAKSSSQDPHVSAKVTATDVGVTGNEHLAKAGLEKLKTPPNVEETPKVKGAKHRLTKSRAFAIGVATVAIIALTLWYANWTLSRPNFVSDDDSGLKKDEPRESESDLDGQNKSSADAATAVRQPLTDSLQKRGLPLSESGQSQLAEGQSLLLNYFDSTRLLLRRSSINDVMREFPSVVLDSGASSPEINYAEYRRSDLFGAISFSFLDGKLFGVVTWNVASLRDQAARWESGFKGAPGRLGPPDFHTPASEKSGESVSWELPEHGLSVDVRELRGSELYKSITSVTVAQERDEYLKRLKSTVQKAKLPANKARSEEKNAEQKKAAPATVANSAVADTPKRSLGVETAFSGEWKSPSGSLILAVDDGTKLRLTLETKDPNLKSLEGELARSGDKYKDRDVLRGVLLVAYKDDPLSESDVVNYRQLNVKRAFITDEGSLRLLSEKVFWGLERTGIAP